MAKRFRLFGRGSPEPPTGSREGARPGGVESELAAENEARRRASRDEADSQADVNEARRRTSESEAREQAVVNEARRQASDQAARSQAAANESRRRADEDGRPRT
ncbi:MAG: hypothetical protein ACLPUT_01435 [Solirubrobacteraceae bacterium]|jgi:hypothetical protein